MVIMGSDGVWDTVKPHEALDIVAKCLKADGELSSTSSVFV
jgi:serine/threonine protein phosphatase PrpC